MELSTFDTVGRRIVAANHWNRPWFYFVGGAFALVNALVHAEFVADAVVAWISVSDESLWIDAAPGLTVGVLTGALFAVAAFVDAYWTARLPAVDTADSFGTVSIVLFAFSVLAWLVAIMVIEGAVGVPQDGPAGVVAHTLSINLFLVGASALLLRYE